MDNLQRKTKNLCLLQKRYRLCSNYGISIPQEHVYERFGYRAQINRIQHTFGKEKVSFKLSRNLLQKIYRSGGVNSSQLIFFCWVMDVFFVVAVVQSYSGLKLCSPFKKNTVRKKLFLSVCHCLDPKISLREMNDLYPHAGQCVTLLERISSTCNFARCCWCCVYREEERTGLLLYYWTWTNLVFVWSYHRTSFLSLFEIFCNLHIQPIQLLTKIP